MYTVRRQIVEMTLIHCRRHRRREREKPLRRDKRLRARNVLLAAGGATAFEQILRNDGDSAEKRSRRKSSDVEAGSNCTRIRKLRTSTLFVNKPTIRGGEDEELSRSFSLYRLRVLRELVCARPPAVVVAYTHGLWTFINSRRRERRVARSGTASDADDKEDKAPNMARERRRRFSISPAVFRQRATFSIVT